MYGAIIVGRRLRCPVLIGGTPPVRHKLGLGFARAGQGSAVIGPETA
jgi:hypothetical protein